MKKLTFILGSCALVGIQSIALWAQSAVGGTEKLKLYGDMRFRVESDWDSIQSNGTKREDRDRMRIRFRMGFNYTHNEHFTFGGRLRSGTAQDQQSPHQTLGDEFESKGINIDKAFFQGKWGPGWIWGGKNSFPFWTQNELFWDEDVNPEGLAAGCSFPLGASSIRLKPTLGFFLLDNSQNSNQWKDKASLLAGQVVFDMPLNPIDITASAGYYAFEENPNAVDTALADLNYSIWVLGAKASLKNLSKPLTLGVDFLQNARDYTATLFNADQKTGYVLNLNLGGLKEKNNWLVGYYYAHIEKYAVVARLAQDDWLRWGSATDTRSSNFKGHEFRIGYALGPSWNIVSRLYLVKGLEPESATATKEDGKRFRIDFNVGF